MKPRVPQSLYTSDQNAFTLIELLATLAIVAMLTAMAVVFIGNYLTAAKRTSDQRTLLVLNDALTRYKTEGGGTSGLTVGASVGRILRRMGQTVSWNGLSHQFLKTGTTYPARSLSAYGTGAQYKFTRYGTYADPLATGSAITSALSTAGYSVGDSTAFNNWLATALAETGSTNYLALTNPATTDRFGIYARVASAGKKVRVWWGDGTTSNYDSLTTSTYTAIAKIYSSAAARSIVIVGDISYISSSNEAELGGSGASYFGGNISTLKSITYIRLTSTCTLSGDISGLTGLTYIDCQAPLSGSFSGLTNLTSITQLGSCTITGSVTALNNLTYLSYHRSNGVTGDLTGKNMTQIYVDVPNTLTGDISNMTNVAQVFASNGNTLYGDISNLTKLVIFSIGNQSGHMVTGTLPNLPNFKYLIANSANTSFDFSSTNWDNTTLLGLVTINYLTTTQQDALLAAMWNNRDANKWTTWGAVINLSGGAQAPSATGLSYKTQLQAYRTPNNNPAKPLWTVQTN